MAIEPLGVLSTKFRNDVCNQTFAADIGIISLCGLNWLRTVPHCSSHLSFSFLKQAMRNSVAVADFAFRIETNRLRSFG